jgi:SAM-dependent methyltransferase
MTGRDDAQARLLGSLDEASSGDGRSRKRSDPGEGATVVRGSEAGVQQPENPAAVPVRCFGCGSELVAGETVWACRACGREVPATLGIPDLRAERATGLDPQVEELCAAYASSDFAGLLARRQQNFSTDDPAMRRYYAQYRDQAAERGRKFYRMVARRTEEAFGKGARDLAVVVGCGVGSCTAAVAAEYAQVLAFDPSLPELILAKKALAEAGVTNVTLVQAYAQRVPLTDGAAQFIVAENVLEHVFDIDGTMVEISRVLAPGGRFVGDSANRYNLLRPEPHVLLWGIGFLPRSLMGRYALWRRGFRGYDRSVHLLSYRELRRALDRSFGAGGRVLFPGMDAYGFPERFDPVFRLIERVPPLAWGLLQIFPLHLVVAERGREASLGTG